MKVVNVSFFYEKELNTEAKLLEKYYTTTGWAEALQRKGVDMIVINRFHKNSSFTENGVNYIFTRDEFGENFRTWQVPFKFLKKISELNADVIHLHHLTLSIQTFVLRLLLNKKTAIIVQHHGGKPPGWLKRTFHNFLISVSDGFFFTTQDQADEWFLKKKASRVFPVMEGATFFNYKERNEITKDINFPNENPVLVGSPVFLWVGNLIDRKDPLPVLKGFEEIFKKYPAAKLYMIYDRADLLPEVKEIINTSEILQKNIHLIGKVPHEEMEMYYRSSHLFVLGSRAEGSGYALSEALQCGCVPVVTDIPSFRMMTDNGKLGALWKPGDKQSFTKAVFSVMDKSLEDEKKACQRFYAQHLSFDAIAETAIGHFRQIIDQRAQKKSKKFSAAPYA